MGPSKNWQLSVQETLDLLESRPEVPNPTDPSKTVPAHPPGVFQTADDYGEETTELEVACRLLGKHCSYALQTTIATHKAILQQLSTFK